MVSTHPVISGPGSWNVILLDPGGMLSLLQCMLFETAFPNPTSFPEDTEEQAFSLDIGVNVLVDPGMYISPWENFVLLYLIMEKYLERQLYCVV